MKSIRFAALLISLLVLAACGSSNTVSVVDAWARPAAASTNSAAYFQLFNGSDEADALLSAESSVARVVEIHETMMMDMSEHMGEGDGMDMDEHEHDEGHDHDMDESNGTEMGMEAMQMVPQERVDIGEGETVVFEPGGLHIMMIDLQQELAVGDEIELTLNFESGLSLALTVEVKSP